jgi:hypothetical protein
MADYINELFLRLACNTPLPNGATSYTSSTALPSIQPFTRSQARPIEPDSAPFEAQPQSSTSASQQKKRNRKPEFAIFIDTDTANAPPRPAPKKTKLTPRMPLAVKTDCGNDSPLPSPHAPDVPRPFSSTDPLWESNENYFSYTAPPPTHHDPTPAQPSNNRPAPRETPRPTSRPAPSPAPHPSPHPTPRPTSQSGSRPARRRRTSAVGAPRTPNNMVLYNLLGLEDWNAGTEQIKLAYKKAAMKFHPDRVPAGQRQEATVQMQRVNAAKEVLLDTRRRRAYNRSGKLPWDT